MSKLYCIFARDNLVWYDLSDYNFYFCLYINRCKFLSAQKDKREKQDQYMCMNISVKTIGRKLALPLIAVLASVLAGCQGDKPKYLIGISQCSNDDWRDQQNSEFMMMDYINDTISVEIKSANDNSKLQSAQIDSLVDMGVNLLVVSPNQVDAISKSIERAYDKGIPVILYDRKINSQKYTAFIGSDNNDIGFELGSYIASQLNGNGRVVEIRGLDGSSPASGRHNGFVSAIKSYPGVSIVTSLGADWEQNGAEKAMDKILATTHDFDYVFAHNDRMAYGAFLSLRKHNLDGKVKVVGVDGLISKNGGVEMVCNGILDASYLNPTGGEQVMELAMKILNHRKYSRDNNLSTTIITKDNAELTLMTLRNVGRQRHILDQLHLQVDKYEGYNATQKVLIWVLVVLLVILMVGIVAISRNYKLKSNLSEQLSKRNDELKRLNEEVIALTHSRLNFFTNVSHELRTPLTLIVDPVEQLFKDEKLSKHGRSLLVIVRRNANALRQLVDDIMDFRKLQNGKMKLHISSFSLADKVRQWVEDFYPTVEKKGQNIVINTDGYTDSDFVADEEKINRIVFNLVSNAVKFTPNGGSVIVSLQDMPQNRVLISVSDTGKGISEKDRQKVFDRFFQTGGTTGGTGIGLAIVKAYAELHGGQVSVESQEGKGANFKVVIPRTREAGNIAESGQSVDDNTAYVQPVTLSVDAGMKHSLLQKVIDDGEKQTLLVVDDNKDIREYLKSILSSEYVIMEAADGNEALQLAKHYVPDLVISDVMMPGIDGLELCSELKQNSKTCHIPIIILTAKSMDEQKIEGYENGADSYITKPFSTELLKARIENLLHSRRMAQVNAAGKDNAAEEENLSSADKDFVARLRLIIQHNMGYSEFGVEAIGREMGFSRVQLYRKVKAVMGISVVDLLRKSRLQRAKSLLEQTDKGVAEIAYEVGFSSPSYFTKCFKDEYEMLPGELRANK